MSILAIENIQVNVPKEGHEDAIRRVGQMLANAGFVSERYIEGMLARDAGFSTAIGNCIAIPHGEKEYKADIHKTGLSVATYPEAIDWNGTPVNLVVGIAAQGDEHLDILENIVDKLEEEADVLALVNTGSAQAVLDTLAGGGA